MAVEGHPFYTKRLDRQRVRQRGLLRIVPDRYLVRGANGPPRPNVIEVSDRPFVEHLIRDRIDKIAKPEFAEAIRKLGAETLTRRLSDALSHEINPGFDYRDRTLEQAFGELRSEIMRQASQSGPDIPAELLPSFAHFIILAVWADVLADDDYIDSRLAECWNNGP